MTVCGAGVLRVQSKGTPVVWLAAAGKTVENDRITDIDVLLMTDVCPSIVSIIHAGATDRVV
jgi:hypothetical protein